MSESDLVRAEFEANILDPLPWERTTTFVPVDCRAAGELRGTIFALVAEVRHMRKVVEAMRANLDEWAPFMAAHGMTREP